MRNDELAGRSWAAVGTLKGGVVVAVEWKRGEPQPNPHELSDFIRAGRAEAGIVAQRHKLASLEGIFLPLSNGVHGETRWIGFTNRTGDWLAPDHLIGSLDP